MLWRVKLVVMSPETSLMMERQVLVNRPPLTRQGPKFYVTVSVAAALLPMGNPVITVEAGASRAPLLKGTRIAVVLTAELKCLDRFPPEVMPRLWMSEATCLVRALLVYLGL